jgi:hypothetical protein
MWKKLDSPLRHSPVICLVVIKETVTKARQDGRSPYRDVNAKPREYEAELLRTQPLYGIVYLFVVVILIVWRFPRSELLRSFMV